MGLPTAGKRMMEGRRRIRRALKPLVPGLERQPADDHRLDAIVCTLTARLCREGRARAIGDPEEGVVIVPHGCAGAG